jgi:hypothetical protein
VFRHLDGSVLAVLFEGPTVMNSSLPQLILAIEGRHFACKKT